MNCRYSKFDSNIFAFQNFSCLYLEFELVSAIALYIKKNATFTESVYLFLFIIVVPNFNKILNVSGLVNLNFKNLLLVLSNHFFLSIF